MEDANEDSPSKRLKPMDRYDNKDESNETRQLFQPDDDDDKNSTGRKAINPETSPRNNNVAANSENCVTKCLRNHLVLDAILQRLSFYDINMNYTLVNKTWNQAAKHYLQNFILFQLQLECRQKLKSTSPTIWMRDINYTNLKEDQKKLFYSVELKILDEELRSVKKKEVWIEFDSSIFIPKKCLKKILAVLQNVERILNFPVVNIVNLQENSELQSKVKTINFTNCKRSNMILLSSLAPNLHLQKLCIPFVSQWTEVADHKTWAKFLQSSQLTLRELELWPIRCPQKLVIPHLPSLTSLVLSENLDPSTSTYNYFPYGFDAAEKFSNLHSLVIDLGRNTSLNRLFSTWSDKTFEDGHNFKSVRHLKINDCNGLSNKLAKQLFAAFPQLRTLDMGPDSKWLLVCLPVIWQRWPDSLEVLSMNLELKGEEKCFMHPFLDEAITGIPEKNCRILRNSRQQQVKIEDCKGLPGISDMKVLQRLSIILRGYYLTWTCKEIVSHVAALYGFQLLPGLEVNVKVSSHRRNAVTNLIHRIIPYVNFYSEYAKS